MAKYEPRILRVNSVTPKWGSPRVLLVFSLITAPLRELILDLENKGVDVLWVQTEGDVYGLLDRVRRGYRLHLVMVIDSSALPSYPIDSGITKNFGDPTRARNRILARIAASSYANRTVALLVPGDDLVNMKSLAKQALKLT